MNFYGIDPRRLPTRTAWEVGKELGDQVISQYIESEGRYPESVGMVFWSGANMRSHGQCIAEFLYLMGIRPIWEPGSLYVKRMEPIPLSELKRPRIDVTARISGLFRDTMPSVVSLMDRAVLLAASLAENDEDNYVRKHISEDSRIMEEKGSPKEEAWREAAYRIFGDAPGTYGAGVAALLEEKIGTASMTSRMFSSDGVVMPMDRGQMAATSRSSSVSVSRIWKSPSRMRITMRLI